MRLNLGCLLVPFIFVALFIAVLGGSGVFMSVSGRNQSHAEAELSAYVEGTDYQARSCRNRDTDANGYISCEALKGGDIVQLECAAPFTLNSGCRVPKLLSGTGISQ